MNRRMASLALCCLVPAVAICLSLYQPSAVTATPISSAVINEFVFNHTGTDMFEFVEVHGNPNTDYSDLTILEIDGDATVAGTIDGVFPVGTTDADGYWTTGFLNNIIENGTVTLLLVHSFSGSVGDDLDTDNDGVLDTTPYDMVVDDIAVSDGGSNDRTYAAATLTKGYDGNPYTYGGASRIPNAVDTDGVDDWVRNDFDGAGLPGYVGTPSIGEAINTPGETNQPVIPVPDPVINEFVANHTGLDTHEFIEVFGQANADYSRFFVFEIEGDGVNAGRIDTVIRLGTTDAAGFWSSGFLANEIENGSMTLYLVENFYGFVGQDLDTDNDGVLDVLPWGRLVDDVAVLNGGPSDWVYTSVALTADFDGGAYTPGGASRIPNGGDTDTVADWLRNDYDGEGLPGFTGSPEYGEAFNTPGTTNEPVADTTPPVIVVDLDRTVLWPPNHKMVEVCATVTVTDNADPAPVFVLTSITSNEPDNDTGDGNTIDDIQGADFGTDDLCFGLRAERKGNGYGREYHIVYTATDFSGNTSTMTVAVRVPHDHSGMAFAATGFSIDGTGLDCSSGQFAIVIPSQLGIMDWGENRTLIVSRDGFEATEMDRHHIYVGNGLGTLRPVESRELDINGDGIDDLAVFYSVSDLEAIQTATATANTGKDKIKKRNPYGAIGLHFETRDGFDYLVANIFDLGAPVSLTAAPPQTLTGDNKNPDGHAPTAPADVSVFPNPFNPTTTVSFELPAPETVSIRIYDIRGSLVQTLENSPLAAGLHRIAWDGRDHQGRPVASGIYLVHIKSATFEMTRKAVMLK
jgi:hypothetical protein